jgi:hypothetical protein
MNGWEFLNENIQVIVFGAMVITGIICACIVIVH